jgi:ketosteroid isomerase-like protein
MADVSIRALAEIFYRASAERDVERALAIVADDVSWLVQGPVDVFPFLGQRHGKVAVREGYRDIARKLEITSYDVEVLLVDGDRSAALIRISSIVRATGRAMSVRTSQFARFRNGLIVEMHAVIDTYDMVEQTLGRSLGAARQDIERTPVVA